MNLEKFREETKHLDDNVILMVTVGNEDDNCLDTTEFELHGLATKEYIEIFVKDSLIDKSKL